MDAKAAAVRYVLSKADPLTAVKIVRSFSLLDEEEHCIIMHDIKGQSVQQIAFDLCTSPETIKRRRRSGYLKMVDALNI